MSDWESIRETVVNMNVANNPNSGLGIGNVNQHILQVQQAMGISGAAVQQPPPSLADRFKAYRSRIHGKDKVLEYIEAQLNMDLFKDDPAATAFFHQAMLAAFESLNK